MGKRQKIKIKKGAKMWHVV
jgi:hypothetical protein